MRHLSIDLETYSSVDLKKSGLYKYVQSPDFQILLCAYSRSADGINWTPVEVIDLITDPDAERKMTGLMHELFDYQCLKHAYNAAFEWYCLCKHFSRYVTEDFAISWLKQWRCTMVHGLYCGYPGGLAAIGEALGLPQDKRKLGIGSALIRTFCMPRGAVGGRTLPQHEPKKWDLFKDYCAQDVRTEIEIEKILSAYPVPENEQKLWELDLSMNAYGINLDTELIRGALACSQTVTDELTEEAIRISGIDNPKSVQQLSKWLETETGDKVDNLRRDTVANMIDTTDNDKVKRLLEIRLELSKTSVKKYAAMDAAVCEDGRVRGLLQFYGANRTGRWAGRIVQVQNLPRNYIDTLDLARALVKEDKTAALKLVYGNVPDTLSQLIRTAFIPSHGNRFVVADFSAIEARVIAWLAGESWRQEVFRTHGKIYEASASAMFGVPIERIKKGNPEYVLRAKGKVAELALGYQGSSGALIAMGALNMGLTEEELPDIVARWRQANKRIVALWYAFEEAVKNTISTGAPAGVNGIVFAMEGDLITGQMFLTVRLPSGRKLHYAKPQLTVNEIGRRSITYMGVDQEKKRWTQLETYGGKLVENTVQAIARDCLAIALQRLDAAGYRSVMHIHDEVVIDCPENQCDLERVCKIMGEPIPWAEGLILRADGFLTDYYRKD